MTVDMVLFFILAISAVATALGMLLSRSAVYSAMFLVLNFGTVAVFYILLNAPFIAMSQVSVYAGAIMVLFLFVIMLLNLQDEPQSLARLGVRGAAVFMGSLFVLAAARLFVTGSRRPLSGTGMSGAVPAGYGTTEELAKRLFTHYLFAFEITSVLLLVAVIGAVVLAKRKLV